jgi:hypothetical protein
VLLFLRSKNNNKHAFQIEDLNSEARDCFLCFFQIEDLNPSFVSYAQPKGAYCWRLLLFPFCFPSGNNQKQSKTMVPRRGTIKRFALAW